MAAGAPGVPGRILIVGQDSTGGWRAQADALAGALQRAGADVRRTSTGPPPRVRTLALTDLAEARLARRAAQRGIAEHRPDAVLYMSVTAALLWPRPGAISLDGTAAENRRGRHGIWQRGVERRRLAKATLLLPWSPAALAPHDPGALAPAVTVPPPIDLVVATDGARDVAAVTYAADPDKRRLHLVTEAWRRARRPGEQLIVTGLTGYEPPPDCGIISSGRIPHDEFLALLRRTRTLLAAPRREEFGIAALEALATGAQLVTTPAAGAYPAAAIARELDPRLVTDDLATAIRQALDDPRPDYAERATRALSPYSRVQVDRTVAEEVLPRLLTGSSG